MIERETDAVALVPARQSKAARADLEKALHGRGAAVGPAGGWRKVPDSLRLAVAGGLGAAAAGTAPRTRRSGRTSIWPR